MHDKGGPIGTGRRRATGDDQQERDKYLRDTHPNLPQLAQLCIPQLLERTARAAVHYSSIGAYRDERHPKDANQAAKAALIELSKSIANHYAVQGLCSSSVFPGTIDTPLQVRWCSYTGTRKAPAAAMPLERPGRPGDMSNPAGFRLSDLAANMAGTGRLSTGGYRLCLKVLGTASKTRHGSGKAPSQEHFY
ncbi:MAG: SDR family oxidoreductase [Gammaproteobacteria bacterium]